ncbi:probable phospholipid-transporting ATPase IA isoform X2 [Halyomorpha halys]|uniref:probable phospholipid-transporting ATPase IA isoform X2 n=2 Tax=Halyomorpha halys TaxID=286706 RepID=UPI0006D5039D|nr:probable phospholipid-transporting ATPase IA isoform X2 [Halyomorpha halys]
MTSQTQDEGISETSFSHNEENPIVQTDGAVNSTRVDGDRGNLVENGGDSVDCVTGNPDYRIVFVNRPQPSRFLTNCITTAKYTPLTFFPSFLYEQFRRYSNCFFLLIALLQQIPDVSPTGRFTTLVPLIFILLVSAAKEIIEDYKRHRADGETNKREIEVLRDGNWEWVQWQSIVVGDIVKVHNNNFFPADLIVLASSEPQGMCYIETMNLDGETNLKIRQSLADTCHLLDTTALNNLYATIECELPNKLVYEFNGTLKEQGKPALALGPERVLLRGAMLRNTSWVFGVVIYTGHETKLLMNSTRAPLKRSTVDRITNHQVLMLFFLLILLCIISALCNELWTRQHSKKHWYIALSGHIGKNFAYNLLTFIILYNNLIPISLQVTLEVVRFVQAIFINMDVDMYHEESDTPAMARTSNLNEELGMVKYIFSDKTGTLTRNVMEFKKCSAAGKLFEAPVDLDVYDIPMIKALKEGDDNGDIIREFLILMSICHTVIPEKTQYDEVIYHASSPDERALLQGARSLGFVFDTRTPNSVEVEMLGVREKYEILNVIEFTSARKRMSVISRTPTGKIILYCKGADSVIYERLSKEGQKYKDETLQHLEEFATAGLRTLCFAMAEISQPDYEDWQKIYHSASTSMINREMKVEEAANLIEKDLILLGATAVEDRLQDKVPETISALSKAGINIWVLTGDKQETAINIGYSTKLIVQGMPLIVINESSLDAVRETVLLNLNNIDASGQYALVIDGQALRYALTPDVKSDFLQLCIACKSVICCRVSPMQKAEVVDMVSSTTKSVTLAIGDGANDVAMIQKAHVGVGISGVEGLQAACASDYSIAQFRFLLKLLFVHGAWNYSRMCKLILYSFYKNICLYVMELWFAIYSGWSGQILFERWTIGLYNVLFTAAPPLAIGLFDKVCSSDTMLRYPKLYGHRDDSFGVNIFWLWIGNALVHSILLFWLPMLSVNHDSIWPSGKDGGYLVLGNIVYTYVVVTVCLKAGLHMNFWTVITHLAIWGSILAWFVLIIVYSHVWPILPVGPVMTGMDVMIYTSVVFWCGLLFVPIVTLLPDITFLVVRRTIFKSLTEAVRESEIKKKDPSAMLIESKPSLTETARLLKGVRSVFNLRSTTSTRVNSDVELSHGFAFSQEEGGAVAQSDVIRAYNTNIPKPGGM